MKINKISKILFSLILSTGLAAHAQDRKPATAPITFSGPELVVPLVDGTIHPITNVNFGDSTEYKFVVDTGASVNVIDTRIAEAEGFEVVGTTSIGAPGGNEIPVNIVLAPRLYIGGGLIENAELVAMDIDTMTGGLMQGVIGLPVFRQHLLVFDQGQNQVRVSTTSLSAESEQTLAYTDTDGHIQIAIDVAGTEVATHVDTGSMAAFTLPMELKGEVPTKEQAFFAGGATLVGGSRSIHRARIDGTIEFVGVSYKDPLVGFMDPSPGYANVGSRVLREFVVSIDQRNKLISFEQRPVSEEPGNPPRRLGIEFRGMPDSNALVIGHIQAGSLGELSGFQVGDLLVSVNGREIDRNGIVELGELIRGSEPLKVKVKRDGEATTIEIP